MMSFKDFIHKYNLKNKARSNIKIPQVLSFLGLNVVGTYVRDGSLSIHIGIVILHPSKGTHWVANINEFFFDSYGCGPLKKLFKFIAKRNGHCFYSENGIQGLTNKQDFYCPSYRLNIIYLKKVIGIDFKHAGLNLHCQMIQ